MHLSKSRFSAHRLPFNPEATSPLAWWRTLPFNELGDKTIELWAVPVLHELAPFGNERKPGWMSDDSDPQAPERTPLTALHKAASGIYPDEATGAVCDVSHCIGDVRARLRLDDIYQ